MKLCSIASGSSGNCVYVETEKTHLLVDAGYSGRQIMGLMEEAGLSPRKLDGIFVTHEHADHIKGVGVLSRRFKIPIFANRETWKAMERKIGRIAPSYHKVFDCNHPFPFGDLLVHPFCIHHDAENPVGYTFRSGKEKVTVLTDTGYIDERMMETIRGSQIYYLEANHDVEMLLHGPYPEMLKERILSTKGHLSNAQCGRALTDLLCGEDEVVLLAHMSIENNEARLCERTVKNILMKQGLDTARKIRVQVAPRFEPSGIFSCIYKKEEEEPPNRGLGLRQESFFMEDEE